MWHAYAEGVMVRLLTEVSTIIRKLAADTSGATAIEYGLIAAGIAVAIVVTVAVLGDELAALFGDLQTSLANMSSLSTRYADVADAAPWR